LNRFAQYFIAIYCHVVLKFIKVGELRDLISVFLVNQLLQLSVLHIRGHLEHFVILNHRWMSFRLVAFDPHRCVCEPKQASARHAPSTTYSYQPASLREGKKQLLQELDHEINQL
jgi:hypothetical protein